MRTLIALAAGLLALSVLAAEERKPYEVSGTGAFPLSDTVTSLWLDGAPRNDRPQPLLMVYYKGAPGWHNAEWEIKSEFGNTPAWVRLTSPTVELSIEYGPGGSGSKVQGQPVNLSVANVFLVSPVADPTIVPTVEPLGLVTFAVPPGSNPASHLLEVNPEIKAKVLR